jgi:hypothetical protein
MLGCLDGFTGGNGSARRQREAVGGDCLAPQLGEGLLVVALRSRNNRLV